MSHGCRIKISTTYIKNETMSDIYVIWPGGCHFNLTHILDIGCSIVTTRCLIYWTLAQLKFFAMSDISDIATERVKRQQIFHIFLKCLGHNFLNSHFQENWKKLFLLMSAKIQNLNNSASIYQDPVKFGRKLGVRNVFCLNLKNLKFLITSAEISKIPVS